MNKDQQAASVNRSNGRQEDAVFLISQDATYHNGQEFKIPLPLFMRHLVAFGLLLLSRYFVSQWYFDRRFLHWILFAASFGVAVFLATKRYHRKFLRIASLRWLAVFAFGLLVLPWAEWLDITYASSRESWTRLILQQAMFVYGIFIVLDLLPPIRRTIHAGVIQFLNFFSRKSVFFLLPILFFLLTAAISLWVNDRTPFLQDSAAHLFQAKVFREFLLNAPEPPHPQFFSVMGDMLVMREGRWFSMYQPGFSILLAMAMFLSAEWLLSPFLGALTILLWMIYAKRWHGTRTAVVFGLISLVSPFLVMMSSTLMVYTPELFFASVVILLCRWMTESKKGGWWNAALFAALVGVMLVRSFSSLLFLSPILIYTIWTTFRQRSYAVTFSIVGGVFAGGLLLLYYQSQTTGDPFLSGYFLEYPKLKLGFGEYHTPQKGLSNLSNHLLSLNLWLTGWYSGCLLFLIAFLLSSSRLEKWDYALVAGCVLILFFYFFHSYQDLLIGPRYYYIFSAFLLLLVARSAVVEKATKEKPGFILPLLALSWLSFLPVKLPAMITQYNVSRTFPGNLHRELDRSADKNLLIFLEESTPSYFVNWNDPFLRGPAIISRDLGDQNVQILKLFPNHKPVYFRPDLGMDKLQFASESKLFEEPSHIAPGAISMFQLALAGETAAKYEDRNIFDVCYDDLLKGETKAQYNFIREQLRCLEYKDTYRGAFEKGLLHVAMLLLLPKVADDELEREWTKSFDWDAYRRELDQAETFMVRAGPIGWTMLSELKKIRRKIDRDRDGILSESELTRFLNLQLSVFHEFGN